MRTKLFDTRHTNRILLWLLALVIGGFVFVTQARAVVIEIPAGASALAATQVGAASDEDVAQSPTGTVNSSANTGTAAAASTATHPNANGEGGSVGAVASISGVGIDPAAAFAGGIVVGEFVANVGPAAPTSTNPITIGVNLAVDGHLFASDDPLAPMSPFAGVVVVLGAVSESALASVDLEAHPLTLLGLLEPASDLFAGLAFVDPVGGLFPLGDFVPLGIPSLAAIGDEIVPGFTEGEGCDDPTVACASVDVDLTASIELEVVPGEKFSLTMGIISIAAALGGLAPGDIGLAVTEPGGFSATADFLNTVTLGFDPRNSGAIVTAIGPTATAAVPEPSTGLMLLLGLTALVGIRRGS